MAAACCPGTQTLSLEQQGRALWLAQPAQDSSQESHGQTRGVPGSARVVLRAVRVVVLRAVRVVVLRAVRVVAGHPKQRPGLAANRLTPAAPLALSRALAGTAANLHDQTRLLPPPAGGASQQPADVTEDGSDTSDDSRHETGECPNCGAVAVGIIDDAGTELWSCSSCGQTSPKEGAEEHRGWAARTLRQVPVAGKPLHWASQHKALLFAGATVAGFGAAGLVPAAMIWGGARVFRTATRGPRNMIRNKTQETMERAKVALNQNQQARQQLLQFVGRRAKTAGQFAAGVGQSAGRVAAGVGQSAGRVAAGVGQSAAGQGRRVWNSDLVTLGKERSKKVMAQAHNMTMTMPGTRQVYQGALVAPGAAAAAADRSRQAGQAVADRSRQAGQAVADRSRQAGQAVADRSRQAGQAVADRSRQAGQAVADRSRQAGQAVADRSRQVAQPVADIVQEQYREAQEWHAKSLAESSAAISQAREQRQAAQAFTAARRSANRRSQIADYQKQTSEIRSDSQKEVSATGVGQAASQPVRTPRQQRSTQRQPIPQDHRGHRHRQTHQDRPYPAA